MKVHFASIALLLSALPAFSTTYSVVTVGSCAGLAPYGATSAAPVGQPATTIGGALALVSSGGTVYVCPANYAEQVSITKPVNITGLYNTKTKTLPQIVSPSAGLTLNTSYLANPNTTPYAAAQVLASNTTGVNITGLWVNGQGNKVGGCGLDVLGIYYKNASGTVNQVTVLGQALLAPFTGCQSGQGIYVESGYGSGGSATVTVENSTVSGYQKNGITGDGSGTKITVSSNYVQGQGPTTGAAENGIQISDGACGSATSNTVVNNVYTPGTVNTYAATGILIYATNNATVWGNTLTNNQYAIQTYTDPTSPSANNPKGTADSTTIEWNTITNGTSTAFDFTFGDGIDACSNSNTIEQNTITSNFTSGIHLDSTCGTTASPTGSGDVVSFNSINKACAGVLVGGSNDLVVLNCITNVQQQIVSGNVCPGPPAKICKPLAFPLCRLLKL